MIQISDAAKTYETRDGATVDALSGIDLEIGDAEFVTLVGPSGCGKSTLLRLVAGLAAPSGGRIAVDGEAVDRPRRDIGVVFQSPTLLPWASILDNVLFPLKIMRAMTPDAPERARALLRLAGLEEFAEMFPGELSGGMQQRAAICRALVNDPAILLMDEPFGALDALTREEMSLELLRIWSARPKTILFVTHSIPEAVLLSDRVVVMSSRPGRIAEVIDVPLPRPRSFDMEALPEFQDRARRIRALICGTGSGGSHGRAA
ncbi:MAG: ABC transporter ATP-binding protein [Bauldia litoralis]